MEDKYNYNIVSAEKGMYRAMYSILVVEDEEDIRRAIIDIIEWDKLGFELVGETGNGQEALALTYEVSPDVILTDIKMPFMDGITLAQRVREINPITKIVFLSGFNDFDFAISAIKLNVIDYLLKPISAKELTKTLMSIKKKLDEERQQISNISMVSAGHDQVWEICRMNFLISLVSGELELDESAFSRHIARYSLKLTGDKNVLFVISFDSSTMGESKVPLDDNELLKFSVTSTVHSISTKYLNGEIFTFGQIIIGILSDTEENIDAFADILINEVHQSIKHFYGFSATIGVSDPYVGLSDTREAYSSARSAVYYKMIMGDGKIIYLSDVEKSCEFIPVFSDNRDLQFRSIIKTGSKEELDKFISEIFFEMEEHRAGPESYSICVIEIYAAVLRALKSVSDIGDVLREELAIRDDIMIKRPDKQRKWLFSICRQAMDIVQNQQKTSADVFVEKGYDYMRKNFSDPYISLRAVSAYLHISSSYFSAIFKKSTGQSFTEALIKIRMDAAMDMILTTNKKIFEIAEKTGYSDQHYFSYCFKKYFGQSPGDMRSKHIAEQRV